MLQALLAPDPAALLCSATCAILFGVVPTTLKSAEQGWLLLLLVLWALLLFGGFLYGRGGEDERRMPLSTRIASSLVLVVAGWSWFAFSQGSSAAVERYALLVALGMTCGLVGDLFMARLLPVEPHVLAGIGAFAVCQVLYVTAFLGFGNQMGLDAPGPRWAALAIWLVVGCVGWYLVVFRGQKPSLLHWAALPYALLLASTAGLATGLALQAAVFIPLAVGACLFLLSDLILAGRLFSGLTFPQIGDVIWLTYGPGQMLIVFSVAAALRLAGAAGS